MRIVDILYSLPFMFFVIILMVVFGRNIILLFVALGAVEWLTMARIVRGQTLSVKRKEFIEAAHAAGVSNWRIVLRHIIPNVLGPVVVYVTLTVPEVIMTESFLSFLGLGVQEPYTSWGVLISEGAGQMESAPWMLIYPGAVPRPSPCSASTSSATACATRSTRRTGRRSTAIGLSLAKLRRDPCAPSTCMPPRPICRACWRRCRRARRSSSPRPASRWRGWCRSSRRHGRRQLGLLRGKIWAAPDAWDPDPELERLFYEGDPGFP